MSFAYDNWLHEQEELKLAEAAAIAATAEALAASTTSTGQPKENPKTPSEVDGVVISQAQKDMLNKDLNFIDILENDAVVLQNNIDAEEVGVNSAKEDLANANALPHRNGAEEGRRNRAINAANNKWSLHRDRQNGFISSLDAKRQQIVSAKQNYDNDLIAIQNSIKLQIQASIASTQSETQAAQNQVTLQQNDPRLLLQKAEAKAEADLKAIELQATLDKQNKDANIKIIGLVSLVLVFAAIGLLVIKKVF